MNHKYPIFRITYQIRSIVSVLFICLLLAVSFPNATGNGNGSFPNVVELHRQRM